MSRFLASYKKMQQIEQRKVADLIPYARNARTHNDEQVAQIAASIREFGWTNPILVDGDNGIIAGHGRLLAARKLGLDVVPVIELAHMSESQKRAYILADNKLALNAGWDNELLSLELGDLQADGFDLSLAGFGNDELVTLLAEKTEGLPNPDDVPEPPAEPVSKPGDVWVLGRHRLMCGDSTDALVVEKVLDGVKPALCLTDPPYGINRDKGFSGFGGFGGFGPPIARREYKDDEWDSDIPPKECFDMMITLSQRAIIFGGNFFAHILPQGQHWLVWDKKNTMPTFGDAELAWTNFDRTSVKIKEFQYNGLIGKEKERFHPTQKPVGLFSDILSEYSDPGDSVTDWFSGSGTTIIAAEETGRCCYAIELSPTYVDVAVERWQNFTGQSAVLEGDGRTFNEVRDGDRAQEV